MLVRIADNPFVQFEGMHHNPASAGRWIAAKYLKPEDTLLLATGQTAIINAIEVEELDRPETTYNFEVADFHTYYVGSHGGHHVAEYYKISSGLGKIKIVGQGYVPAIGDKARIIYMFGGIG